MVKEYAAYLCALLIVLSLPALAGDHHEGFAIDLSGALLARATGPIFPLVSTGFDYGVTARGDIFNNRSVALNKWTPAGEMKMRYGWGRLGVEARGFLLGKSAASAYYIAPVTDIVTISLSDINMLSLSKNDVLRASARDDVPVLSLEADLTYDLTSRLRLFAGPRYIRMNQSFKLYHQSVNVDGYYETFLWSVDNNLMGCQAGARYDLARPTEGATSGWTVEVHGAVGAFVNKTDLSYSYVDTGEAMGSASGHAIKITPAFEAGSRVGYRLSSFLEVHVDYGMLWVDSVCEAARQLAGQYVLNYFGSRIDLQYRHLTLHGINTGVTIYF